MPRKMMPPLPETAESEQERFKRFAKALLAVPKSEISQQERIVKASLPTRLETVSLNDEARPKRKASKKRPEKD